MLSLPLSVLFPERHIFPVARISPYREALSVGHWLSWQAGSRSWWFYPTVSRTRQFSYYFHRSFYYSLSAVHLDFSIVYHRLFRRRLNRSWTFLSPYCYPGVPCFFLKDYVFLSVRRMRSGLTPIRCSQVLILP